ncbi:MAG: NAD-dependent epimerase/dehydratase family protein [Leptolyngbya sp. SIO4C1]|nr:NAD-dependent epimerase/dehydratase family protein [Leptolyngbya sp. SIO4C1]
MILVTGATGQVGSDLVPALRALQGADRVVASGRRVVPSSPTRGRYESLDVTDLAQLETLVRRYEIQTIYHLAGMLSARGEQQPERCWQVNVGGLQNVLNLAQRYHLKVFWPSSIAAFGPSTPKFQTPQDTVQAPTTLYGITKVTGELLCQYYAQQFGVDVRSLRLPGLVSYRAQPGGGTTDFAVEMFYAALQNRPYTCFVQPDTRLPMMYMPDAVEAILQLMRARPEVLSVRSSYNLAAVSFSAQELATEIRRRVPGFTCRYQPDFRQAIANSWPVTIDDSRARQDWGWQPVYGLSNLVKEMLQQLASRLPLPQADCRQKIEFEEVSC